VTDKTTNKEPESQESKPDESDDIIDVEVVETINHNDTGTLSAPQKPKPWGWIIACILMAFIGGLFSAEYAREGLRTLGLIDKKPEPSATINDTALADLQSRVSELMTNTERLEAFSGQQETIIANLRSKQNDIETNLNALSDVKITRPLSSDTSALETIRQDIEEISKDLTRLASIKTDSNPDLARLESAIAVTNAEATAIKQKITNLETALNSMASNAIEASPQGRLVLLITRMKEKATNGLSFANDINALRIDLVNLPALDQQAIGSELGKVEQTNGLITPYNTLLTTFDKAARNIIHAQEKSEGSFLASLFTVRKRGPGAQGIEGLLYNAEKRLIARDIKGAVSLLNTINTPAKDAASIWITNAQQHVSVLEALDTILLRISTSQSNAAEVNQ
jgi:hypothetical protein